MAERICASCGAVATDAESSCPGCGSGLVPVDPGAAAATPPLPPSALRPAPAGGGTGAGWGQATAGAEPDEALVTPAQPAGPAPGPWSPPATSAGSGYASGGGWGGPAAGQPPASPPPPPPPGTWPPKPAAPPQPGSWPPQPAGPAGVAGWGKPGVAGTPGNPAYPGFSGSPGAPWGAPPGQPGGSAPWGPGGFGAPPVRKTAKWPFVLAGLVVVVAMVAGVLIWLNRDQGPAHPSSWDPRVASLADWVAKERGLTYKQPVYVDFLTPAQYTKAAGGTSGSTDGGSAADKKQQQDELDQQVGELRALGLVQGKVDLKQAGTDLNDSGTLAYYSPTDERIFVRGTELTPGLKVTLAHELTHVLQDQHFDLKRLAKLPSTQRTALRSVAEGDARRIEQLYVKSLSSEDRKSYQDEQAKESKGALNKLAKTVPPALLALFGAPYDFGTEFIGLLDRQGGNSEIDRAFTEPPTSDEQLFDPFTYLDHDDPKDVKAPAVPSGVKQLDEDTLGATLWYLILATRMDPKAALAATDGWGGDRYVEYRDKEKVCIADRFRGDTPKDTEEMGNALGLIPKELVSVKQEGDALVATFCDPGQDNKLAVTNDATQVIQLPVLRSQISIGALTQGADRKQSQCYGQALVDRLDVPQLTANALTPEIEKAIAEARAKCI